jgi:hypothetical protein
VTITRHSAFFLSLLTWHVGLVHEHIERESKLPDKERYIHTVMTKGDIKIAVTMHPTIANIMHAVAYLCIDYTFKRVSGELNEWEIAGFSERLKRRKL